MIPDVMYAITTREFRFIDAILRSYSRFTVKGASYPGIIPAAEASTEGIIYFNVDEMSLAQLDRFEGELYRRTSIQVEAEGGKILDAEAYVIKSNYQSYLSSKAWDVNKFTKTYLETFLENYQGSPKNSY